MIQDKLEQNTVALTAGIQRLRKTNTCLGLGLPDSQFESQELNDYLLRQLDSDIESDKQLENRIKGAVYLAIKRSKWKPRHSAKQIAELAVDALRDARLTTLYEAGTISARQFKEESERNLITNAVSTFNRVKKTAIRKTVKGALATALGLTVGGPAGLMAAGIMLATELVPKDKKEKIIAKARNVANEAGSHIFEATSGLYGKGRKIASKVAEKMAEIADSTGQCVATYARPVVESVRKVAKTFAQKLMIRSRKLVEKIKMLAK